MAIESVTLRNYRAFGSEGATLPLTHEFTGIVGVNNSGKSTLLRSFYELRDLFRQYGSFDLDDGRLTQLLNTPGLPIYPEGSVRPALLQGERAIPAWDEMLIPRITITFSRAEQQEIADIRSVTFMLGSGAHHMEIELAGGQRIGHRYEQSFGVAGLSEVYGRGVRSGGAAFLTALDRQTGERLYADWPAIRTDISQLADSLYIGSFRNAIHTGGADYFDLSIGSGFVNRFDGYKTGPDYKSNEAVREMTTQLAEIFGFDSLDVSASSDKTSLTYLVDGKSFRGSELGAGIAQFVVVAANVLVRKPWLLLIDEPELNLHASLQSRFLTLLARFTKGPVMFSTHSLGLARSAADRVLVTERDADRIAVLREYNAVPNLSSTLGELGYGGLHDTTYKAVLLVEGPTEVKVFQELVRKFGIKNEVVIVPLGGDAMAAGGRGQELAELRRLSNLVFAVVDSERSSAGDPPAERRQQFAQDCKSQGIDCHILQRRALENYLDQAAARQVMSCKPAVVDFDSYERPNPAWAWSKERNWRVAAAMTRKSLAGTDLGGFLERLAGAVLS